MKRRLFVGGVAGSLLMLPLGAAAQSTAKVPRIGYLNLRSGPIAQDAAFIQGLRELGYLEGRNINIEYRWAAGNQERLAEMAAELVRLEVDVIVTAATPPTQAAMRATSSIPIVMAASGDPAGSGVVTNLARPGGNVTGMSLLLTELAGKRLQLLCEILPNATRIAVLVLRTRPVSTAALLLAESRRAAQPLGLQLLVIEAGTADDLPGAFASMQREHAQALMVQANPLSNDRSRQIAELAAQHHLPAMYDFRIFVDAGGLVSLGPSISDSYRRAATYVDKILRGAKPADLPVEQPRSFELVVNLKTAKALGLTIPQSVLLRADEVIR